MARKYSKKKQCLSPSELLKQRLLQLLTESGNDIEILNDIPCKWEKHGDLVILPNGSFRNKIWLKFGNKLWDIVAEVLQCIRIARKYPIHNDNYRSPKVEFLRGSNSWVIHIDNKIKYTFDVTQCMFSSGNISEKLRIAKFSCENEVVVDLYAGIGYFTLPFLIHAKAAKVHACEWNPHAIEALSRNVSLNNVETRCVIHFGDNQEVCPKQIADRVNLGLIPSSESGWETACRALKPTGGVLHIHGTVTSNMKSIDPLNGSSEFAHAKPEWVIWSNNVAENIGSILYKLYGSDWNVTVENICRIKSYAPHIDHIVVDILCKFNKDFVKI